MSLRDTLHHRRDEAFPYPQLPASLTPADGQANVVHTILPYHTPYLGLRARLSQVWLNRWTILLLLILCRVLLGIKELNTDLGTARQQALSACTGVEAMGSALASMPHYMSAGVNEAAAKGIEAAVNGLETVLLLMLQGVEEIIVFMINLVIQTYTCLLTAAVQSSLGSVLGASEDITTFLNDTLTKATRDIQSDAASFQTVLDTFVNGLNDVSNFFGSDSSIPVLTLPSLAELSNVQLPTAIATELQKLNESIPTFPEVQAELEGLIRTPFDLIRTLVNESLTVYSFNRDLFPVPEKEQLTFCSDNPAINNFFDGLLHTVAFVRKILIGVIIGLAVLVMIPMGYREWWKYRSLRSRAYLLSSLGQDFDPVDVVSISSRPFSSTVGLKAASHFKSSRKQVLVRWFVAYCTTTTALFVLTLGLAGLISALGQYIVLRQIETATPELAAEVGQFADLVVSKLTAASEAWAVDTNGVINSTNAEINAEVFGWVVNATTSVNGTLNSFVDLMQTGIQTAFNNTPLEQPVSEIFNCLILLKVNGIQKGLTWAHDNAHVTFPTLPNDTFSLGAAQTVGPDASTNSSSFLSNSSNEAADSITEIVLKLADKWRSQLLQETYISCGVVGVWLAVVLIGLLRTLFMFMKRDKTRGEGGKRAIVTADGEKASGVDAPSPFTNAFVTNSESDFHHPESTGEEINLRDLKGYKSTLTGQGRPGWRGSSHGQIEQ